MDEIQVVLIDDTSINFQYKTPVEGVTLVTKDRLHITIAFAIIKNRTAQTFSSFFDYVKSFFPSISIILMDRHFGQFNAVKNIFTDATIIFCCVHVSRNIETNLGTENDLYGLFWEMRNKRTKQSERKFITCLKKQKNSQFKTLLLNQLEYFLPSKIDQAFKNIGWDDRVDSTNGIEAVFAVVKNSFPNDVATYVQFFAALNVHVSRKIINYNFNAPTMFYRKLLHPVIGDEIHVITNDCMKKIVKWIETHEIDINREIPRECIPNLKNLISPSDFRILTPVQCIYDFKEEYVQPQYCFQNVEDTFSLFEQYVNNMSKQTSNLLYHFFNMSFTLLDSEVPYNVCGATFTQMKLNFQTLYELPSSKREHSDHIIENIKEVLACLKYNELKSTGGVFKDPNKIQTPSGRKETKLSGNATHSKKPKKPKTKDDNSTCNRKCSLCGQKGHKSCDCVTVPMKEKQRYFSRLRKSVRQEKFDMVSLDP